MLDVPSLHVITDEQLQARFSHVELCSELVAGGADAIQFREKRHATTAELCAIACRSRLFAQRQNGTRLMSTTGLTSRWLRRGWSPSWIERSRTHRDRDSAHHRRYTNSWEEQKTGRKVDYCGVWSRVGTQSKASPAPVLGLEQLRIICERSPKPVIAIGNIRLDNLREVILAGAAGIAVLSAIVCAPDPRAATRSFKRSLAEAASALG